MNELETLSESPKRGKIFVRLAKQREKPKRGRETSLIHYAEDEMK
jgi:hypothetical protein